jgi:hypothetical protein
MRITAGKTAVAIASAACMAAAFTMAVTAPALAQSARTTPSVQTSAKLAPTATAAQTTPVPCADEDGLSNNIEFWRCTGTSATSKWVGSTCDVGEYNAATTYNVYLAINDCSTRVWLHGLDYPLFETAGGFAYCISPHSTWVPAAGDSNFPENIQVSENTSSC